MISNRGKILSELVSIDAWRDPFSIENGAGVFVELTFKEGRLGGNSDEVPFTFKIRAKKALMIISAETPLAFDRTSIARNHPEAAAEYTRILSAKDKAKSSLTAGAKLTPAIFNAAFSGEASKSEEFSKEDKIRLVQSIPRIVSTSNPISRSKHSWELEPSYDEVLMGQPWDPINPPRLIIKPLIKVPRIDPAITVELRCALEDIEISELVPKQSQNFLEKARRGKREINEAVAVQHLKMVLAESHLEPKEMDNRFSNLILARGGSGKLHSGISGFSV